MNALVALLLSTAPLTALDSPAGQALIDPLRSGLGSGAVGQWATFQIDGGAGRIHFWRLAVVGEETDPAGRPACWLELQMGQHPAMKAPLLQLKMLVARAVGLNAKGVSQVFIAVGAEKPNALSTEAVARLLSDDPPRSPRPAVPQIELASFVGKPTSLLTLAGTVRATPVDLRLRSTLVKRVWVSAQVPLLQLAKLELPGIGHTIEVRDFGVGAKATLLLPQPGTAKIKLERYDDLAIEDPNAAR